MSWKWTLCLFGNGRWEMKNAMKTKRRWLQTKENGVVLQLMYSRYKVLTIQEFRQSKDIDSNNAKRVSCNPRILLSQGGTREHILFRGHYSWKRKEIQRKQWLEISKDRVRPVREKRWKRMHEWEWVWDDNNEKAVFKLRGHVNKMKSLSFHFGVMKLISSGTSYSVHQRRVRLHNFFDAVQTSLLESHQVTTAAKYLLNPKEVPLPYTQTWSSETVNWNMGERVLETGQGVLSVERTSKHPRPFVKSWSMHPWPCRASTTDGLPLRRDFIGKVNSIFFGGSLLWPTVPNRAISL